MSRSAALFLALLVVGCGGRSAVPVSGRVTMDNKPLANATVTFQPIGKDPGPGSSGTTDADGKYTLQVVSATAKVKGAVVGKHRVSISLLEKAAADSDAGRGGRERVPETYNSKSKLEFEVPAGGTDKADFALNSSGR